MEFNPKDIFPAWIGSIRKRGTRDLRLLAFGMFWAKYGHAVAFYGGVGVVVLSVLLCLE